ncbi:hypothetical protein [Cupriavidus sp. DL-D2]|uniref:hypothetical protein n=1 Tax=Cupriavidus sp. DL-D2 TaxID=3144974 RepID=UPI003212305D
MPNYKVTVMETVNHLVDVEAENEEIAREAAIEAVIEGHPAAKFMAVEDRHVTVCLEV